MLVATTPFVVCGAQLETVNIWKTVTYEQTSSAAPTIMDYSVVVGASFDLPVEGVTVALQKPNGNIAVPQDDSVTFALEQTYASSGAMNSAYPNGNYFFQLSGAITGNYQVTVSTAALPVALRIVNYDALQSIAANSPVMVSWQAVAGATEDDLIVVGIESEDGAFSFESDPLVGTETSITIPNVPAGTNYNGFVVFLRVVQASFLSNDVLGLYVVGSGTAFSLHTNEPSAVFSKVPAALSVAPGGRITIIAEVSAPSGTTYRWQRLPAGSDTWADLNDGGGVVGSSTLYLTLEEVPAGWSGDQYRCVATNGGGVTYSSATTLSVAPPYLVSTFSGLSLIHPLGIGRDLQGNLYLAEPQTIRKVTPNGQASVLAGLAGTPGVEDGAGSMARFTFLAGLAVDRQGNIFVSDRDARTIRKITPAGLVSTYAGLAGTSGTVDGKGMLARFSGPEHLAVDGGGNVYVADAFVSDWFLRRIAIDGQVSTFATYEGDHGFFVGLGNPYRFSRVTAIAADPSGIVYVCGTTDNILRITPGGALDNVLIENNSDVWINWPTAIAVDPLGYLIVSDSGKILKRIAPDGRVSTLAGMPLNFNTPPADGIGGAMRGQFTALAADPDGTIYFCDRDYSLLRKAAPVHPVVFTTAPQNLATMASAQVVLSAAAGTDEGEPVTYQWRRNGVAIPGATSSTFTITYARTVDSGVYSVVAEAGGLFAISEAGTLTITKLATSPNARLMNLSTRALSLTGDNVLIPGFVIGGSQPKRLLIRAVAQKLAAFGLDPNELLPDPRMALKRWDGAAYQDFAANDNWGDNANVADLIATSAALYAFTLDVGSPDAALLIDLPPGQYTVIADDTSGRTGVALVELYDADAAGSGQGRLINISTRGYVGTGAEIMIPGIVVSAEGPKTLLIRAVGPRLTDFGVSGVLADPEMTIHRRVGSTDTEILYNDNWQEDSDFAHTSAVAAQVYAFGLPPGSKDAALVVTLLPGIYTVHASGVGGATGVALVEVYEVP